MANLFGEFSNFQIFGKKLRKVFLNLTIDPFLKIMNLCFKYPNLWYFLKLYFLNVIIFFFIIITKISNLCIWFTANAIFCLYKKSSSKKMVHTTSKTLKNIFIWWLEKLIFCLFQQWKTKEKWAKSYSNILFLHLAWIDWFFHGLIKPQLNAQPWSKYSRWYTFWKVLEIKQNISIAHLEQKTYQSTSTLPGNMQNITKMINMLYHTRASPKSCKERELSLSQSA